MGDEDPLSIRPGEGRCCPDMDFQGGVCQACGHGFEDQVIELTGDAPKLGELALNLDVWIEDAEDGRLEYVTRYGTTAIRNRSLPELLREVADVVEDDLDVDVLEAQDGGDHGGV